MLGAGKFIDNIGAGRSIVSEFEISRRRFLATNLNWQKYSENRLRKVIPEINERGEKIMKEVVETKILSNEQSGATIVNLYRGNKLSDDMFSKYLRSGEESKLFKEVGENGWNKALENTHISEMAFYHQQPGSSRGIARKAGIPSTPFISTTTSPHVATRFSLGSAVHPTPGRSYIFEFEIPNSRVAMNPFNQAREFEALVGKRIIITFE